MSYIYIIMFMYSQNHVIHMSTFMFTHAHIFRYLMCTYFFPKETLQPTKHLEPNLKNPKPSLKNPKANPRPQINLEPTLNKSYTDTVITINETICAAFCPAPWCLNHPQPTFYMFTNGMFGIKKQRAPCSNYSVACENRYCHSAVGGGVASRFFIQVELCTLAIHFSACIYIYIYISVFFMYFDDLFTCVYFSLSHSPSLFLYLYIYIYIYIYMYMHKHIYIYIYTH